ncbi:acetyl-CoA synthetase-like protein [Aspergillus brunneoviolaceus CBS 621.78]|uniref:Acetyl-CoA synthetase-like protein n=1 Tax=Aspergillus brunneoviolaceus CBS 621.78 TaxID=1450534 RepID=A0ACD1GEZ4_9EURO|nr:acetyl-CoA synthetase-like protein [Aspergillus brunneoviolaceus CBS 621.78]RAH47810.1 acetyl-CoA synthetase-like protein [Aspergillus brunneoviolaceus CBS 621.78]
MTAIVSPPICILPRVALSASADTSARAASRPGERESVVLEWSQTDARKWLESGSKVDSLVRVAWALLLRSYTSLDHICFELATSTRRQFELYDCHITGTTTLQDILQKKGRVIDFDPMSWSRQQVKALAQTFHHAISAVIRDPEQQVGNMDLCSEEDVERMARWNMPFRRTSVNDQCVTEIVLRSCRERPEAIAISAWDGEVTYGELERLTARLATKLIRMGVGPEVTVPILTEKSKWLVVAALGVMRAGGSFLTVDVSNPFERIRKMIETVSAPLVACSRGCESLSRRLTPTTVIIEDAATSLDQDIDDRALQQQQERSSPSDALYVVFTSGSTSEPKGLVLEHRAFCASALATIGPLMLGPDTRRVQSAANGFTLCNRELLLMPMVGGCLCIPSDNDIRMDLAGFINRHRCNYAFLTPVLVDVVKPLDVPTLRVLLLGGTTIGMSQVKEWAKHVRVMYGYGATETAGVAILAPDFGPGWDERSVGYACDPCLWVVDVDDPNRLAPVGAVGELVLQGKGLARGYWGDEEKSRLVFMKSADWQTRVIPYGFGSFRERLYRTGDLVRYNLDGSIQYISRKDSMIKVSGRRVDPGEIEHHLTKCPELVSRDGLKHRGKIMRAQLAAVIEHSSSSAQGPKVQKAGALAMVPCDFKCELATAAKKYLMTRVPGYMMPPHFFLVEEMPLNKSGKFDRFRLKSVVSETLTAANEEYPEPEDSCLTPMAISTRAKLVKATEASQVPMADNAPDDASVPVVQLRKLIAQVLKLPQDTVRADSNFFAIGGDSITSFQLAWLAGREGLHLTEDTILNCPILSDMAQASRPKPSHNGRQATRTSSGKEQFAAAQNEGLRRLVPAELYSLVLEMLPLADFQQTSLTMMNYRYFRFGLPLNFDRSRVIRACQQLIARHTILRTAFVAQNGEYAQVVLKDWPLTIRDFETDNLDRYCSDDNAVAESPSSGRPPFVSQLVTLKQTGDVFLVFRIAHALYDGLSASVLVGDFAALYNEKPLPATSPFSAHLQAVLGLQTDIAYNTWRKVLQGTRMTSLREHRLPIPGPEGSTARPAYVVNVVKTIPAVSLPSGITLASLLKAAWAVTLLRYFASQSESSEAVVFGQVVHGRNVDVAHADRILGPCISIVPVSVLFEPMASKIAVLHAIQQQHLETMPYSALGYRDIVRNCTTWPTPTPLASFVRVRNYEFPTDCWLDGVQCHASHYPLPNNPSQAANVHILPEANLLHVNIATSSHILSEPQVEYLVGEYCQTIQSFDRSVIERESHILGPEPSRV